MQGSGVRRSTYLNGVVRAVDGMLAAWLLVLAVPVELDFLEIVPSVQAAFVDVWDPLLPVLEAVDSH